MKKITKEYTLYNFDELSNAAKEKALRDWNDDNDFPFLGDMLKEFIEEELEEAGYTHDGLRVMYDLSYCQGSGLMFEGVVGADGYIYTIRHSGNYYHELEADITATDSDGTESEEKAILFAENFYRPLCRKAAKIGREEIEHESSEEYFSDLCDANGYTFLESGEMMNA